MGSVVSYLAESRAELMVVSGAVFAAVYLLYRRHVISYSGCKLAPAWPSLPVVGSLPFMPLNMKDLAEFCISPNNKLGKVFSLRLGSK